MECSPGADRLGDCVIAEPGCWLEACLDFGGQICHCTSVALEKMCALPWKLWSRWMICKGRGSKPRNDSPMEQKSARLILEIE